MHLKSALSPIALLMACTAYAQTPFSLTAVTYRTDQPDRVFVSTAGTPPATTILTNTSSWRLVVKRGKVDRAPVDIERVEWSATTLVATIVFDVNGLGGADPSKVAWTAMMPDQGLAASSPKPPDTSLQPAKGKDDADIYVAGSFLAGGSTSPIYSLDAKFQWSTEFRPLWSWGINGSIITNGDAKPPVDRTRIDPDSIKGSISFSRIQPLRHGAWTGMQYDLLPLQGEFARKFPSSNFVPAAYAKFIFRPVPLGRTWLAFYPQLGFEGGSNLNRPSVLFKQPVDLTGYRGIARLYYAAFAEWYIMARQPAAEDIYRFTIDAKVQARTPFTQEPYVTWEFIQSKQGQITRLRKNTRPEVEIAANYAISKLFGIKAQYLYGSLPPLFQFTDHQVTIGFTFKAKKP